MNGLLSVAAANVDKAQGLASRPVLMFVTLAALSILPFVVLLMTSFVKIAVVLSILRSALGSAQIPPAQIVTGLALILTIFVMAPTGERMFRAVEADFSLGRGSRTLERPRLGILAAGGR